MPPALRPMLLACLVSMAIAAGRYATRPAPTPSPALPVHSYELALRAARAGDAGAARLLYQQLGRADLSPAARAALYGPLPNFPSSQALAYAQHDLQSSQIPVRQAALEALALLLDGAKRAQVLGPLLEDPTPAIRYQAALRLLDLKPDELGLYYSLLQGVVEERIGALEAMPDDAKGQLELARLRLNEGAVEQAATAARRVLELQPGDVQARVVLARALDGLGQSETARETLAEPLRQQPNNPYLQHELGLWLLDHKQPEYALLALTRAVELAPERSEYRLDLAGSLYRLEQPEAAQAQLDQLVRRQPANRKARLRLIELWKASGQLQNVQVLLAELEQQNPDDPALQQELKTGPVR